MLCEGQISGKAFLRLLFGTAQSLPPEDQNYEFKSLDLLRRAAKGEKDARIKFFRTVSAFAANKRGSSSFLILGIRQGKPEQRTLTEAEKNFLKHAFNDYPENFLNPPAVVEYTIQRLDFKGSDDGELVVIRVLGEETPHRCRLDGRCYIREGAETLPMRESVVRLMQEKAQMAKEKYAEDLKGRISEMESRLESRLSRLEESIQRIKEVSGTVGASPEAIMSTPRDQIDKLLEKITGESEQLEIYLAKAMEAFKEGDREGARRLLEQLIEEGKSCGSRANV